MNMLADKKTRLRFNRKMRAKGVPAKACGSCFVVKGLEAFKRTGYRHESACRVCFSEYIAEYNANPEVRARVAKYNRTPAGRAANRANGAKRRARKCDAWTDGHSAADLAAYFVEIGAFNCAYCGGPAEHVDHVAPLARGGAHALGNLLPACADCNLEKGARDPYEFLTKRFPRLAPLFAPYIGTLPLVDSFQ
jgi:5-methylcytosine-specific restriction endonuclease McrA